MAVLQTMLKQPSDLAILGGEKIWSQCSVVGLHVDADANLDNFHHRDYVAKVLRLVWHQDLYNLNFDVDVVIPHPNHNTTTIQNHNHLSKILRRVWYARPLEPHQLSRSLLDLLMSKGLQIFYKDILNILLDLLVSKGFQIFYYCILNILNIFIYISLQYIKLR